MTTWFSTLGDALLSTRVESCTSNLKAITSGSLYNHTYKYYATRRRKPIIDNFALKDFSAPLPS